MTESMAWRLALVGGLMAAAVALVFGGGSIGAGVNAVSLSLWHFIQTAQAPARIEPERTAVAPAVGGRAERELTVGGREVGGHDEVSQNLVSMSQAFTSVSAAANPWPLLAAVASTPPSSPSVPTPPSSPAVPASASTAAGPLPSSVPNVSAQMDGAASGSEPRQPPAVGGSGHAEVLAARKDLDGALAALSEAIHRDSRTAEAFKQRAIAYAARKDTDKAIESWTGAIELATAKPGRLSDLDLFIAYGSRAALYDGKHQFAREIADLTQMLDSYRLKPELAEALDEAWGATSTRQLLSSIYRERAKASELLALYDKAMDDLGLAIELDRDGAAEAYGERARIEQKLGHRERALGDLRAAIRLDPGMKEAKEALARLEAEAGPRSSGRVRASPNAADHGPGVRTPARPITSATAGSPGTP